MKKIFLQNISGYASTIVVFTPPNPPKKKQVGQFPEAAFSYPVIANGRLYIRDLGTLWAYDIKSAS